MKQGIDPRRGVKGAVLAALLLAGCARSPKAAGNAQEQAKSPPGAMASMTPMAQMQSPKAPEMGHDAGHAGHQHQAMPPAQASDSSIYQLDSPWQTQDGKRFKLTGLLGRPQVMAMVYSSCKNVCPRIIADMRRIQAEVSRRHPARVGFVLVSIDPEVDTPQRLSALAHKSHLDADWRLLRGAPDDVLQLAALLGVKYRRVGKSDYAHTNLITVLNTQGEIVYRQEGLDVDPAQTLAALDQLLTG